VTLPGILKNAKSHPKAFAAAMRLITIAKVLSVFKRILPNSFIFISSALIL